MLELGTKIGKTDGK